MNALIIEDELPAAEKLERYIQKHDGSINIVKTLTTVETSIVWLNEHKNSVDIIFADIQLSDGLSFEIFNTVNIEKPIIFTTAFDEFAVDAFKLNSIDYILKPITFTEVSKALTKFKNFKYVLSNDAIQNVTETFKSQPYKNRFLVRLGNHIHSIKTEDNNVFNCI